MNKSLTIDSATGNKLIAIFRGLGNLVDKVSNSAGVLSGILMSLVSFFIIYEAISRYFFNRPVSWTLELVVFVTIWFSFLTVAFGLKEGAHVNLDLFVSRLSPGNRAMTEVIGYALILSYCVIFTLYSFPMIETSFSLGEKTEYLRISRWIMKSSILVGMGLTSIQALRMLISKSYQIYTEKYFKKAKPFIILFVFVVLVAIGIFLVNLNPIVGLLWLLISFVFLGVPISFTLGIISAVGLFFLFGGAHALEGISIFGFMSWLDYEMVALPLFIFVGNIMFKSGMSEDLMALGSAWVGRLPGGLAIATMIACAIFSAITGSSLVCAITIGLVAIPALTKRKYDDGMSCGLVASGGTLGILIPPSIAFLVIGILIEESVGKLFMAGIIPGITIAVLLATTGILLSKKGGKYEKLPRTSWKEKLTVLKSSLGTLGMPVFILGGIYSGLVTVTESAALGVIYALVYSLVKGGFNAGEMAKVLRESVKTMAMIVILLAAASALSKVVTMLQVAQNIVQGVTALGWGGTQVVLILMGLLFIMGCFLDPTSCTFIVLPIAAPALRALGVDLIWFAVLFVVNMEIAAITPPVGFNLYAIHQITNVPLGRVIKGTLPFLVALLLGLIIVLLVPQIATWLPSTMK